MEILIIIGAMILVGVLVGVIAGLIWKDERPYGLRGDYGIAIIAAIIIGLMDWYIIPELGFTETLKWIGIAIEPALGALAVLWLVRYAKK